MIIHRFLVSVVLTFCGLSVSAEVDYKNRPLNSLQLAEFFSKYAAPANCSIQSGSFPGQTRVSFFQKNSPDRRVDFYIEGSLDPQFVQENGAILYYSAVESGNRFPEDSDVGFRDELRFTMNHSQSKIEKISFRRLEIPRDRYGHSGRKTRVQDQVDCQ